MKIHFRVFTSPFFSFFKGNIVVNSTQVLSLVFDLEKDVCMLKMIRKTIRNSSLNYYMWIVFTF